MSLRGLASNDSGMAKLQVVIVKADLNGTLRYLPNRLEQVRSDALFKGVALDHGCL
jgi:hypothetical protein